MEKASTRSVFLKDELDGSREPFRDILGDRSSDKFLENDSSLSDEVVNFFSIEMVYLFQPDLFIIPLS